MQDLGFRQARVPVLNVFTFIIVQLTADSQTQLKNRAGQCKIWTTDYGLPTGYKTMTFGGGVGIKCGLGIKRGLWGGRGYKTWTGDKTRTADWYKTRTGYKTQTTD